MKKVYLIRLTGGGDVEEKFVGQEAWDWITSRDMGQRPEDIGESSWEDQLIPDSVRLQLTADGWTDNDRRITSGSWDNDRALMCPQDPGINIFELDHGAIRESLKRQGFEYTGEEYEGGIY